MERERAPGVVGLVFGIALGLLILLAGPLLLFNPWFTSVLQERHEVAAAFDTSQREIERVTGAFLADIYLDGPFDAGLDGSASLLDADERSHMTDVSRLVRLLTAIVVGALIALAVSSAWLRHEPRRRGRIMLVAAGSIGAAALVLAIVFAVAFETAFLAFHEIFFPPGTYLFETGSDLITLFPEGFWFDAALAAGAAIILVAVAVAIVGYRALRSAPATGG